MKEERETDFSRLDIFRRLARDAYCGTPDEKRARGIVFQVPEQLGRVRKADLSWAAGGIQTLRFAGEFDWSKPEIREAARNYYAILVEKQGGVTEVHLFFSAEAYGEKLQKFQEREDELVVLEEREFCPN